MTNMLLDEVSLELSARREMADLGIEGFSSLTEFLSWFSSTQLTKLTDSIKDFSFKTLLGINGRDVESLASKSEFKSVGEITIYQPVGFKDNYLPYSEFMVTLLLELRDIEKRLVQPLTTYLSKTLANNDYTDVVWIDKNIKLLDSDKLIKQLKGFFTNDINRNADTDVVKFKDVFHSFSEISKTQKAINEAEKIAKSIDLSSLIKAENKLSDVITLWIKEATVNDRVITNNKPNIKLLAEVIESIATETELLSVALYQFTVLQVAYNDSLKKLKDNLK